MVKRLMVKTGEYQKDGQTKGRYTEVGVIMSNDKGEYALLDPAVNLAGVLMQQKILADANGGRSGDRVMVSIFDNDNQRGGNSGNQSGGYGGGYDSGASGGGSRDLGDDIPFLYEWRI
tara:strand:+ start:245 stop:598 length:354 start_codon:yes stop_codon:yes gene_type:complete